MFYNVRVHPSCWQWYPLWLVNVKASLLLTSVRLPGWNIKCNFQWKLTPSREILGEVHAMSQEERDASYPVLKVHSF